MSPLHRARARAHDARDDELGRARRRGPPSTAPGFEDVKAGAHASEISEIAAKLGGGDASIGTAADKVDAPDLSLKSDGLREEHAGEVMKTIIDPSTPYTSAKSFEDLGLSAELLRGLHGEMKFEKPSKFRRRRCR